MVAALGTACLVRGCFYFMGGFKNGQGTSICFKYTIKENKWSSLPCMPKAVSRLASVVVDDAIYVLGGCCNHQTVNLVSKLDLESHTWSSVSPMCQLQHVLYFSHLCL